MQNLDAQIFNILLQLKRSFLERSKKHNPKKTFMDIQKFPRQ